MSDSRSRGWDTAASTEQVEALPLCEYHAATTEHLSTFHSNQIAVQARCCIALVANRQA